MNTQHQVNAINRVKILKEIANNWFLLSVCDKAF